MSTKIASLNLCLGLQFKKNLIKKLITENNIDILFMQETEIKNNLNHNELTIDAYNVEIEKNVNCARVGAYISTKLSYIRRFELEGINLNLLVIDLLAPGPGSGPTRIINLYRQFNPVNGLTERSNFIAQLELVAAAWISGTIIVGDFNLDWDKRYDNTYAYSPKSQND